MTLGIFQLLLGSVAARTQQGYDWDLSRHARNKVMTGEWDPGDELNRRQKNRGSISRGSIL